MSLLRDFTGCIWSGFSVIVISLRNCQIDFPPTPPPPLLPLLPLTGIDIGVAGGVYGLTLCVTIRQRNVAIDRSATARFKLSNFEYSNKNFVASGIGGGLRHQYFGTQSTSLKSGVHLCIFGLHVRSIISLSIDDDDKCLSVLFLLF
ncbi:hypothetical protein DERP_014635 [Dermatophagoides pteronyssinus]|uniref:Uncharacterized protein n=1 Tax=Dermatophagoides pteronyssinus TaxID=6956 RepID=A0ABQ8IU25_DERPT|nr:hypothetical protein DERP_014635 [Dermatophagoides pteronyssinus]